MLAIGDVVRRIVDTATGRPFDYDNWASGEVQTVKHRLVICGGDGTGEPEITAEKISLNGTDEGDMGHETFYIPATVSDSFTFCKTARKPYDVVVVAILAYLAAKWDFDVSSDGDVDDWEAGVALANEVVGEPIPNPLIVDQLVG